MKQFVLAAAAILVPAAAFSEEAKPAAPEGAKVKGEGNYAMFDSLKWETPMGPEGPAFAFVEGDMKKKGPAAVFMKFPGGFDSGWHTHDGDYSAVAVKGTMTHQVQGGTEKTLTPGSYWTQPGKANHRNTCVQAGGACVIYATLPKGFSFNAMTPEGKPVPHEKAPK